ncbi:small integral membrane protein 1 isoform X1 [Macaca mulatta]
MAPPTTLATPPSGPGASRLQALALPRVAPPPPSPPAQARPLRSPETRGRRLEASTEPQPTTCPSGRCGPRPGSDLNLAQRPRPSGKIVREVPGPRRLPGPGGASPMGLCRHSCDSHVSKTGTQDPRVEYTGLNPSHREAHDGLLQWTWRLSTPGTNAACMSGCKVATAAPAITSRLEEGGGCCFFHRSKSFPIPCCTLAPGPQLGDLGKQGWWY